MAMVYGLTGARGDERNVTMHLPMRSRSKVGSRDFVVVRIRESR